MGTTLTDKDRADTDRISTRLMVGLSITGPGIHKVLIEAYLQEAIEYGRTGHWILEEAAEKITNE